MLATLLTFMVYIQVVYIQQRSSIVVNPTMILHRSKDENVIAHSHFNK